MPSQAERSPYVGSRSFRRTREDQRRFFGRDREIEELVGLVVSHSVILVYAASGAGKTSLFDAGVFPKLVEEGFEVLPRARVRADLPPGVVFGRDTNPYVLSLLCWLSPEVDPAALQHRTIAEHLSTVPRPEGTTGRVMMVDQLEELFTFTPSEWQRHQKAFIVQLREALHAIPDLRVVLITREDFLAQLDDLAPILGGLRVRFHLEPLGREAARQAVEGPLASTGASRKFDQGVADLLVADLSRVKLAKELGGDPRGLPGPYVEPVQLQIVCDALWNRLPADAKLITAEHLEHYGDVEETLEHLYADSIDACVRATGCDRERLARWFDDELITPSDTRRPVFRGADETEGLPNRVVAFLEDRRLVHAEDRATGRWYEITHDRLIRPIRVVNARWRVELDADRAQQQRRRRGRRIALIGGSIFAGVLVASNVYSTVRAKQQARQEARLEAKVEAKLEAKLELERAAAREHAVTDDKVKAQRERCPHRTAACDARAVEVFDSITEYYWSQGKFDKLVALLKGAADLIPPDYGVPPASPSRTGNDRDRRALLRVRYNSARGVDELRLRQEWTLIAAQLSSQWGLSVSPRIQLAADDRVPPSAVDITASPESCSQRGAREDLSTSVQMPLIKQEVLISEQEIRKHPRLSALFDRYRDSEGWTRYEALEVGGPWWFVDTWSLPIWRFAGHPAVSREAVLAIVVASELSNRPDFVMDCAALGALLLRAAEVAPVSVREAEAARTLERLRGDLIELVRVHRWSLKSLPEVLDALANHPDVTSPEAARRAVQELRGQLGGDVRAHGPWRSAATVDTTSLAPKERSRELADALPGIEPPIRVELGPDVMPLMVDAGVLRPEVTQQLSRLRRDVYLRYGVIAPGVRFHEAPDLHGLRIEILNQDARSSAARPIDVPPQSAHTRLLEELDRPLRADRARWVTSDVIASSLEALPAGERTWLARGYSVTDLKQLARRVVGGGDDRDGADTLRDLPWLLGSLAFWRPAHAPDATIATLASALRDTQRARLRPVKPGMPGDDGRIAAEVRRGIEALGADRFDEAEGHFASAIRVDRAAAVAAFLRLHPALSALEPGRRLERLVARCHLPRRDEDRFPARPIDYEIEELLGGGTAIPARERWKLELCAVRSIAGSEDSPREVERRVSALVASAPDDVWTKEEAFFLARRWLLAHRQQAAPPPEVPAMQRLLARGVAELPTPALVESTWRLLSDSLGSKPVGWTRDLVAHVARGLPAGRPSLKLEVAGWLSGFTEHDAVTALELVDTIEPGPTANEAWSRAWVRANILERLGEYGSRAQRAPRLDEAARAFRALAEHATTPSAAGAAFSGLANVHVEQGDVARARVAIREGIEKSKDREPFDVQEFFIELADGQVGRAGAIMAERRARAPEDEWSVFLEAIFSILQPAPDFEHAARNYIFRVVGPAEPARSRPAGSQTGEPSVSHDGTAHERTEDRFQVFEDYVRFLLYWGLARDGRIARAEQLIAERMREIDRDTWTQRLALGDTVVWREMLIAYFAGEIPASAIFGPLASDAAFASSGLGRTGLTRNGLRAEATFYAALRDHVTGDPATRESRFRERLNEMIGLGEYGYFEHRMAQFLLGRREPSHTPAEVPR